MASFTGNSIKNVYKDILHTSNSNTGIGSTIKQITCGDGDTTALFLSNRNAKIQPSTDTTTNTVIYDADGNALLTVDSTNDLVKAGIGQHSVNTQYAHFGIGSGDSVFAGASANNHYAIPFNGYANQALVTMGTGTEPATSLTISTTADDTTCCLWYVMDNMTIDRVVWWSGADAATGDTTRCHLMSFDIDSGNGSTGGDLSNGVVLADGADITNAGYEQSYYQQMTIQSANVNANKAIMFMFRSDSVNSDFSINATIKYHLR
ncbi:MAG: hypothetical protein GOVbin1434_24 [Prokaryotic dsDNA virus sp.]|nr:MAG: hypothetical protein GOVbin1434_24 [Prokaryotic dsDNA virus sp.]|tara:strand:+ start:148 stop:936 length:789 start_codon:yes stop_codon:yes gene_type:complete